MKGAHINIGSVKGVNESPVEICKVENFGIKGDAHAGSWHRQVSLLGMESIEKARYWGPNLNQGDFAENITTEGIDLLSLPLGSKIEIGDVILEVNRKAFK